MPDITTSESHVTQTGPVVQLQHVAATLRPGSDLSRMGWDGLPRHSLAQLQHVAQTGPVVQLQHGAATLGILPCQNGYYDNNIKVLLIVVKEVES